MNKYEQLIEYIINEDEAKARELFHQIVVEKSREIYESLIDSEDLDEMGGNNVESLVDEITGDEEGMSEEEDFGAEEEFGDEEVGDEMDMDMDMDAGDEELGGDDIEGRVMDLEDALDELKAEFDALMGGEGEEAGEEDFGDEEDEEGEEAGEEDFGDEEDMMEAEEDDEEEDDEEDLEESVAPAKRPMANKKMTEAERIREYVEKLGDIYGQEPAKGEGHEVGKGGKATVTAKSVVAGKNDMGGTAANIAKGGAEQNPDNKPVPQPNNQYSKGKGELKHAGQFKNVPGGNAGKTSFKTKEGEYSKEHGAEGQTTGGKVPVEKKSILKHIGK